MDLAKWQGDYGNNGGSDADGDGGSDGADFLAWQRNYAPPIVTPFTLGNGPSVGSSIDNFNSNLVINEADVFTNNLGVPQAITLETFNFHAQRTNSPLTPFVVSVNSDNVFTVLAIGTPRTSYSSGVNNFAFADGAGPTISVGVDVTIAIGFLDANPDGTGNVNSSITWNDGGDEIWYSGSSGSNSGSVEVGQPPTRGQSTFTGLTRDYQFTIGMSISIPQGSGTVQAVTAGQSSTYEPVSLVSSGAYASGAYIDPNTDLGGCGCGGVGCPACLGPVSPVSATSVLQATNEPLPLASLQYLPLFRFRLARIKNLDIFIHMVKYYQDQLDYVFFALADKTRREILLDLRGGFKAAQELADPHSISLPAISKHLKVLERANLLKREKRGRQHFFSLELEHLKSVTDWIGFFEKFWSANFDSLEKYLKDQAGAKK